MITDDNNHINNENDKYNDNSDENNNTDNNNNDNDEEELQKWHNRSMPRTLPRKVKMMKHRNVIRTTYLSSDSVHDADRTTHRMARIRSVL